MTSSNNDKLARGRTVSWVAYAGTREPQTFNSQTYEEANSVWDASGTTKSAQFGRRFFTDVGLFQWEYYVDYSQDKVAEGYKAKQYQCCDVEGLVVKMDFVQQSAVTEVYVACNTPGFKGTLRATHTSRQRCLYFLIDNAKALLSRCRPRTTPNSTGYANPKRAMAQGRIKWLDTYIDYIFYTVDPEYGRRTVQDGKLTSLTFQPV